MHVAEQAPKRMPVVSWLVGLASLAAVAVVYVTPIVGTPFYTKGEPREAMVVQSIVERGQWIAPLRNGDEIPSKPPMFHWLGALASVVAGRVDEMTTRVPSVAAGVAAVGMTAYVAGRCYGPAAALVAGLIVATCQTWVVAATTARVDMVLVAFMTLALVVFFRCYWVERRPLSSWFYVALACAVLTKGPVGAVLPLAIVGATLLVRNDLGYVRLMRPLAGLACAAIPLAWYVAAGLAGGEAFFDKLVLKENVFRVIDPEAVGAGHVKPFYAYLWLLPAGFAPWSVLLPGAVVELWRGRRTLRREPATFFLLWFGVTFLLFSAAGSKRTIYLLPAYPALAILIAHWFVAALADARPPTTADASLATWSLRIVLALVLLPAVLGLAQALGVPVIEFSQRFLSRADRANTTAIADTIAAGRWLFVAWALAALALMVASERLRARGRWIGALVAAVALVAVTIVTGAATFQRAIARTQTLATFMPAIDERYGADTPIYFYRGFDYGAAFYAGRPIPRVDSLAEIDEPDGVLVLTFASNAEALEAAASAGEPGRPPLVAVPLERHTYHDNPRRDALLLFRLERPRPT
jgi:4-amino-4-deoxy-L-arabinose transferase-like glycosyltransferase